jgi:hypothetical protein
VCVVWLVRVYRREPEDMHGKGTSTVAVMRRSRSRAGALVLLPHLPSTSYLSCIIDTLCK